MCCACQNSAMVAHVAAVLHSGSVRIGRLHARTVLDARMWCLQLRRTRRTLVAVPKGGCC